MYTDIYTILLEDKEYKNLTFKIFIQIFIQYYSYLQEASSNLTT